MLKIVPITFFHNTNKIKRLDANKIKIDEKSYKNILITTLNTLWS